MDKYTYKKSKKISNIYIPGEENESNFNMWKYTGKFLEQKDVLNFLIENIFGKDSEWKYYGIWTILKKNF